MMLPLVQPDIECHILILVILIDPRLQKVIFLIVIVIVSE